MTLRLGRTPTIALIVAAIYAFVLIAAGFVVPVYESTSTSSSGEVTNSTDTLVGVNGAGVLIVLTVPLLVTALVTLALWQRSRRLALPVAWTLTGLMAVLNLLAMLTIGVFFLPITIALIVACSTSRARSQPLQTAP